MPSTRYRQISCSEVTTNGQWIEGRQREIQQRQERNRLHVWQHCQVDSSHCCESSRQCVLLTPNFAVAFALEIKLMGGNNHTCQIIVATSACCQLLYWHLMFSPMCNGSSRSYVHHLQRWRSNRSHSVRSIYMRQCCRCTYSPAVHLSYELPSP